MEEGILHRHNFMLAVRREMGWPVFTPANDCLFFCSGRPMDIEAGSDLARICEQARKDAIYSGWNSATASEPTSFAIVCREMVSVDVVERVIPFVADDEARLLFVSTRSTEMFCIDGRGSLVRLPGKPKGLRKGRELAMKRIKRTAAAMGDTLLENNQCVPPGAAWREPDVPFETIVRFG